MARPAFEGGLEKAEPFLNALSLKQVVILIRPDGKRSIIGPPGEMDKHRAQERELPVSYDSPKRRLPMFDPNQGGGRGSHGGRRRRAGP